MSQFPSKAVTDTNLLGEVYLVGGPVRDQLLDLKAHDRDWLVVGATPERMKAAGFVQVGKDFPVFLHPISKEEYALARTERKSGKGYQGFVCHTSPDVSLEEDLMRRDFTINAMALDQEGVLHDPYNGLKDLEARVLRHVSPAFAEDPLRVLRGARFLARLHYLGFSFADETLSLMRHLVETGELEHLSAERVWSETERAIGEKSPEQYFLTLKRVQGLAYWFAEFAGVTEVSLFELPCFLKESSLATSLHRWAWMLHHLNTCDIESLCSRLKAPRRYLDLARLVQTFWSLLNMPPAKDSALCLRLLERAGAFKQGGLFEDWLMLWSPKHQEIKAWWQDLAKALGDVTAASFVAQGLKGPAIGAGIKVQRLGIIEEALHGLGRD
ncbi:CCA tRNA nucleotidyltransferase [Oceanospirillum maris]|uniref:CCA tRNA nucleotidyltransferase n=1 Tax=Oceanospirillum maris TaxID=64977 RepID=UPI0004293981|nr:CCA tRNA nucleotidyltransferase [Oceanospirillum maris]